MLYERKIKYVDYYENGQRVRGAGFVRLESKDTSLKMDMNIKGLHPTDSFDRDVVLKGSKTEAVLGRISFQAGSGCFRYSCDITESIGSTGIPYTDMKEINISVGGSRELRCTLENKNNKVVKPVESAESVESFQILPSAGLDETDSVDLKKDDAGTVSGQENAPLIQDARKMDVSEMGSQSSDNGEGYPQPTEDEMTGTSMAEALETEVSTAEVPIAEIFEAGTTQTEAPGAEISKADIPETEVSGAQVPRADIPEAKASRTEDPNAGVPGTEAPGAEVPNANVPGTEAPGAEVPNADVPGTVVPKAEDSATEARMTNPPQEGVMKYDIPKAFRAESRTAPQETKQSEYKPAVKLMEDKWQQLSSIYPHIRPFQDEREYLSLSPSDFVLFPESYYRAANNSFLLHGFYNYKHLILARVERRGEVRYYLGVPGNYYEREKQVAVMFGFESFESDRESAKTGDFGYYLMRMEL